MANPAIGTRVTDLYLKHGASYREGTVAYFRPGSPDTNPDCYIVWDDGSTEDRPYNLPEGYYGHRDSVVTVGHWQPILVNSKKGKLTVARYAGGVIIIIGDSYHYSVIPDKDVSFFIAALTEFKKDGNGADPR